MVNPVKSSDLYNDKGDLKKLIVELEAVKDKLTELAETEKTTAMEIAVSLKRIVHITFNAQF